jgi:hypothetical protein
MYEPIPGRKLTNPPMIGRLVSVCGNSSYSGATQMTVSCRSFEMTQSLLRDILAIREVQLKGLQNLARHLSGSFHHNHSAL